SAPQFHAGFAALGKLSGIGQEGLCPASSWESTVEADVCPFDKALDLADAVLGNDQKVAGAQVRERLRGGGAHGGLEVQDFGFRQIGADPAEENDLRMLGAGSLKAACHGDGLKCGDLAAHFEFAGAADFAADDEIGFFEVLQDQGDFRVLQAQGGFFENCGFHLVQGQTLQFEVAYDLQVDETVGLYDNRLVEFRRVPVMDLHDIGWLEAIPRLAVREDRRNAPDPKGVPRSRLGCGLRLEETGREACPTG